MSLLHTYLVGRNMRDYLRRLYPLSNEYRHKVLLVKRPPATTHALLPGLSLT
jgi:hypothetical protein